MFRYLLLSVVVLLISLLTACEQPQENNEAASTPATATGPSRDQEEPVTIVNPGISAKLAERIPLLPRLDTLEGKTLYMVDVQWGGPDAAYSVFEEMQDWFATHMPSVRTVLKRTRGNIFSDDPQLWQEIAEKGDAAIVGISG